MTVEFHPNWVKINRFLSWLFCATIVGLVCGSYIYLLALGVIYLASLSTDGSCAVNDCHGAVAFGVFLVIHWIFSATMFTFENILNFKNVSDGELRYLAKLRSMLMESWKFRLWDCCVMILLPFFVWSILIKATLDDSFAWFVYAYLFALAVHSVKYLVAFTFELRRID